MDQIKQLMKSKNTAIVMMAVLFFCLSAFLTFGKTLALPHNDGSVLATQTVEGSQLVDRLLKECGAQAGLKHPFLSMNAKEAISAVVDTYGIYADHMFLNATDLQLETDVEGWIFRWTTVSGNVKTTYTRFIHARDGKVSQEADYIEEISEGAKQ